MLSKRVLLFCTFLLFSTGSALADSFTFDFSFTGTLNGSGTFEAVSTANPDRYRITSLSGMLGASPITLMPLLSYGNDNFLYTSVVPRTHGSVDTFGISFSDASNISYNLYYVFATNSYRLVQSNPMTNYALSSFTVGPPVAVASAVTPEPSGFMLLATGLAGVAGVFKRRFANA